MRALATRCGPPLALFVLFLGLAVFATRPLVRDLHGSLPVGPDPLIDLWTVDWLSAQAFNPAQLFHGNIFHPYPYAVLHSDLSLGTALLVVPLRLFVHDPVPLYNLALMLGLAFGAWGFAMLVRELTGSTWAAAVTGVWAAFGSHQLYHLYHLNLLSIGWLGLLLLALEQLRVRPGPKAVLLGGLAFALNALSSGYYAVAAALLAMGFGLRHREFWRGRALVCACGAALLAGLLLTPYMRAIADLRQEEHSFTRPLGMSSKMAFSPREDLGSHGVLHASWRGSGGERLFPGLLPLALAGLALVRRRPQAGFYAAAAAGLLLISLGPSIAIGGQQVALPYRWLFALPPLDAMRHPYTFAAVAGFCLAILAGLGLASLDLRRHRWLGPAALCLSVAETWAPPMSVRAVAPGVPEVYARVLELPAGPVLEIPPSTPEAMLWAARQRHATVNGIGAFAPPQALRLENRVQIDWLQRTPEDVGGDTVAHLLRETFGARYLIVEPQRPGARRLAGALEVSPAYRLLAVGSDGRCLYEVLQQP